MLKISHLDKNSIASKIGLKRDDVVVAFNGERACDLLDVAYFDSQSEFSMSVERNGKQLTFNVKKDANVDMGWDFYE